MAMNGGFGSPTFFFYPRSPTTSAPSLPGPVPTPSKPSTLCLAAPPWPCCSPGCLPICGCVPPRPPGRALAASLLYLALPYHVAMDLYARFALAEFWAFAWAPLILLGQDLAHRGRPQGLPLLILGLALLAFSHLPSLLLMMGLVTLRAFWFTRRTRTLTPCWQALGAQGWGFAWQPPCCCPPWRIRGPSPWS